MFYKTGLQSRGLTIERGLTFQDLRYVEYKILLEFFQNNFGLHEQSAVKIEFSTYVCYAPDGLFWLNLYLISHNSDNIFESTFKIKEEICLDLAHCKKSQFFGTSIENGHDDFLIFCLM